MDMIIARSENTDFSGLLIDIAEDVLECLLKNNLTQEPDRKAVYLTVWKKDEPTCYFKTKIGTSFPDETFRKNCYFFSEEKIERLIVNPGHVSSSQSRNPDENKWGGAVVVDIEGTIWYISVSGLKEWEDETMSLIIGAIGDLDLKHPTVKQIIASSGKEEYVQSVVAVFNW